jgi:site-specific DNA recombinase
MEHPKPLVRRCAIYTRKSSEEGLEQDFNSLHAQREACEAFIKSQAGEGWRLIKAPYDDGGLSGGTMERPALQRMLADINQKLIDVVVVYKVDRLTRSLSDFARIIEVFDARGVSFVEVTQQFNTTTSMGRLTLNVLLSFAQFEREVTGERIRDKIAASKQKGMWMGGLVPLGYDVHERRLEVNQSEAETVREIFRCYGELSCVRLLMEDLNRRGIRSKVRVAKSGRKSAATRSPVGRSMSCSRIRSTSARFGTRVPVIRDCWSRPSTGSCGTGCSCCCEAGQFGALREQRNQSPVRSRANSLTKAASA